MAQRRRLPDAQKEREYFSSERSKFEMLVKHALFISNKIGRQIADERRGMASWLFVRACITSHTIVKLFEPQPSGFGEAKYLDQGSIAGLARGLIENVAVMLYIGDITISEDEWRCRKHIIDLHDYMNRSAFLKGIGHQSDSPSDARTYDLLRDRLERNPHFQAIPQRRKKRLLEGDDIFINGRHAAMLEFGWGEDLTRAMYKYLSNQVHSLPMAFHRTEMNRLYEQDGTYAMFVAAFATEFACNALGRGCLHMISLFPYIEATLDQLVFLALKSDYGQQA